MAAEAHSLDNQNISWPTDPKNYQWKGTLSVNNGTWNVLAHCKQRKEDVFLKIKQIDQTQDDDMDQFLENTKNLINIRHQNLLTPVHSFVNKSEIWVVYPRHSGGPLIEVLTSHYPNGIPDEGVVASILYDVACGLHNLHKQQICHRNIRAGSIHIDIDNGLSLLTEFGQFKEIKFKHATGQRDSLIQPEREPFTDPLILFDDENANWYRGDIYSFGITALQLAYGSTPPLNIKNVLQKQATTITTELYDKKCPFSKSFENLIRDCCNSNIDQRITHKKLIEHKFFKSKCQPIQIKTYFSHILKSTEKRINSSLGAPQSFTQQQNGKQSSLLNLNNDENINDINGNKPTNGKYVVTVDQNGNGNHDEQLSVDNPSWTFTTSLRKSDVIEMKVSELANGKPNVVDENQSTDEQQPNQNGPRMQYQQQYNDPTNQHKLKPANSSDEKIDTLPTGKKMRNYHVSFSESESISQPEPDTEILQDQQTPNNNNNTVQINRFKVEFGSRLSESNNTVAAPIEASETYDDDGPELTGHQQYSDDDDPPNDQEAQDSQNSNNEQTTQIKRFFITPAKPEVSADECEDINTNNNNGHSKQQKQTQSPPQNVAQPQPQQQIPQQQLNGNNGNNNNNNGNDANNYNNNNGNAVQPAINVQPPKQEWIAPSIDKAKWSSEQCSDWVGNLGAAYKKYQQAFIDNGVDGDLLAELDDDTLKDIITSALHRKKILTAWAKVQTEK